MCLLSQSNLCKDCAKVFGFAAAIRPFVKITLATCYIAFTQYNLMYNGLHRVKRASFTKPVTSAFHQRLSSSYHAVLQYYNVGCMQLLVSRPVVFAARYCRRCCGLTANTGLENAGPDCTRWQTKDQAKNDLTV